MLMHVLNVVLPVHHYRPGGDDAAAPTAVAASAAAAATLSMVDAVQRRERKCPRGAIRICRHHNWDLSTNSTTPDTPQPNGRHP